jgi:hypothetical protein
MSTRVPAPQGFERVHRILGEAMRAAYASDWPAQPHRGDGPTPTLTGLMQIDLALWLAAEVEPLLPAAERQLFDGAVAQARAFHQGKKSATYKALADTATALRKLKTRSPALDVALNAVAAARSLAKGGANLADVNKFASLAAAATVAALGGAPDRALPAVRAFLERLDDAILTRELGVQLEERGMTPSRSIVAVQYRPAGTGALPALILARLESGSYGLWTKLKARWQWIEGGKEDVLASIPDAHFAAAVAALVT